MSYREVAMCEVLNVLTGRTPARRRRDLRAGRAGAPERVEHERYGIPVDNATLAELKALCDQYGVPFPLGA